MGICIFAAVKAGIFTIQKGPGLSLPLLPAVLVSAFFFGYLHAASPGFGLVPMLFICTVGVQYALRCYSFGTLWYACTVHWMWNYTQDFLFGLPNSGKPAAISFFRTEGIGSPFFYDAAFGIEGSLTALLVSILFTGIIIVIGRRGKQRQGIR